MGQVRIGHNAAYRLCLGELPDRNDSWDERQAWINVRHQPPERRQIWQQGLTQLNFLLLAGRDRWQLRLLSVVDHHAIQLPVIEAEIQQVEFAARHRGIDDQQVEWLATVFNQGQQLFKVLHWRHPVVTKLV